jgi:hypothetical protein
MTKVKTMQKFPTDTNIGKTSVSKKKWQTKIRIVEP